MKPIRTRTPNRGDDLGLRIGLGLAVHEAFFLVAARIVTVAVAKAVCEHRKIRQAHGFRPMPTQFYIIIAAIILAYITAAELMKHVFTQPGAKNAQP